MASDEFAIVPFSLPTGVIVGSTFDITSSAITDFKFADIFVFGTPNTNSASDHARRSIGFCDDLGNGSCASPVATDATNNGGVVTTTRVAQANAGPARCIIIGTPGSTANGGQVAAYSPVARSTSGVANGIRLSCDVVSDAAYKGVAILFGGLANRTLVPYADTAITSAPGYRADLAQNLCTNVTLNVPTGQATNDYQPNFGAASRLPAVQNAAIYGEWDRSSPTDADVIARNNRFGGEVNADAVTADHEVDAFTATNLTLSSPTGINPGSFGAILQFTDAARPVGVVLETLTATSGNVSFSLLGFKPRLVFGVVTLVDATNTITSGATASSEGIFCFDLNGTQHAASMRLHNNDTLSGLSVSDASTLYNTKALLMMDHTGAVVTSADFVSMDANGFTLNGTFAAGRMVVVGIGSPLQVPETVGITETTLEVVSAMQANETVGIQEATQFVSAMRSGETVGILDSEAFFTALVSGELVGILDGSLTAEEAQAQFLAMRAKTAEGGAVKGRTVEGGPERASTR